MSRTLTSTLTGTKADGTASAIVVPCDLVSNPSRTVGLAGDLLQVRVKAEQGSSDPEPGEPWPPSDWDLSGVITLRFGFEGDGGDPDEIISLEYYLQRSDPITYAVETSVSGAIDGAGTSEPLEHILTLTSQFGLNEDGRGGRLRLQTYNPLDADGAVAAGHADYLSNADLVATAASALGLTGIVDLAINSEPSPGPLDWGNADARNELDALLAGVGYQAVRAWGANNIHVYRLPKPGEALATPSWVTDAALPYALSSARGVRALTVVVTSGRARQVIVTTRTLADMEWVWRDPKTGRWLNATETQALYPGSTDPDDIDALNAGPGTTIESRQQYSRLFRAVRIADPADFAATRRMVSMPVTAYSSASNQIVKSAAVVEAQAAIPIGAGQLRNDPESGSSLVRIEGARVHPLDGVIELPTSAVFARVSGKASGATKEFAALTSAQLKVTFAHESNEQTIEDDYYISAWRASVGGGGSIEVTKLTSGTTPTLTQALDDRNSVWIDHEPLVLVSTQDGPSGSRTAINQTAVDDAAEQIALIRAGTALAESGVIECEGLIDKIPGKDWAACSRIEWDVRRRRTILTVNSHEVPDGILDSLDRALNRSLATGLGRWNGPGASAAEASANKTGGVGHGAPSWASGGTGAMEPTAAQMTRGAEDAVSDRPAAASEMLTSRDLLGGANTIIAIITGNTSAATNRWDYDWTEASPASDGLSWAAVTSGRSSASLGMARNWSEMPNGATGTLGNGVPVADLPSGITLAPIAMGALVVLQGPFGAAATRRWWFHSPNGLQGVCA